MKIGITADCSSGLEYAPFKHNVKLTRTTINFENEVLIDGIDITAEQFYNKLENTDYVPSTSAPTIGELCSRVEEYKKEGCTDVIHFPISFGLSAYGENWQASTKDLFDDINIHIFNSKAACIMEGYQAYYASILSEKGYNVEEIFSEVTKLRDQISTFFVVDDIKYLVKNGRLGMIAGMIGNFAKIKPILNINEEGKIIPFEKVRTHRRALDRMLELAAEKGRKYKKAIYVVLHSNRYDDAVMLSKELAQLVNNSQRIEVTTITPTVGAHIGSKVLGIACLGIDGLNEEIW